MIFTPPWSGLRRYDGPLLYFAHIPKTGGTSFRHSAMRWFGARRTASLYDLGHRDGARAATRLFHRTGRAKGWDAAAKAVLGYCDEAGIRFLTTHRNVLFRRHVPPAQTIAILREPVDRLISLYNHEASRGNIEAPFEHFVFEPALRNAQFHSLRRSPLSAFGLCGVYEHYDVTLGAVNAHFGLSLRPASRNRTKVHQRIIRREDLTDTLIDKIRAYHIRDVRLHACAGRRFVKKWGEGA